MKQKATIVILALVVTLGCAAFPAKRTPKLDKPRIAPELRDKPAIRLIVEDCTSKPKKTAKALEHARKKFPYLVSAEGNMADPDFTINLEVRYHVERFDELAGYSLLAFPAFAWRTVAVDATIEHADGTVLGSVHSIGKSTRVVQMHLLWVLPVAAPLAGHVDRKMWTNSFRDVFIQAAELIAEHQAATAGASDVSADRAPSS